MTFLGTEITAISFQAADKISQPMEKIVPSVLIYIQTLTVLSHT